MPPRLRRSPSLVSPASALTITLNNLNTVTPGTDAYRGFTTAARFWETVIKTT
jgi:hypothetical protein